MGCSYNGWKFSPTIGVTKDFEKTQKIDDIIIGLKVEKTF